MIRTGLIGNFEASEKYSGIIHQHEGFITTGVWDSENRPGINGSARQVFSDPATLTGSADAVIFTSVKDQAFDTVRDILKDGKHVMIYPDPGLTYKNLEKLRNIAEEAGVLLYLAHHLHNASPLQTFREYCPDLQFININRYGNEGNRSGKLHGRYSLFFEIVSLLSIIDSPLRKYYLTSVPIHSSEPSLVNIRMEFVNGSSASLTVNRFSKENYRITEVFSADTMVRYDSRDRITEVRGNYLSTSLLTKINVGETDLYEDISRFIRLIDARSFPADDYISGIMTHKIAGEITMKLVPGNREEG